MSCGKDHFEPITFDRSSPPAWLAADPEAPAAGVAEGDPTVRTQPRALSAQGAGRGTWGGRRRGAGAPKGNLNALKHGRNSRYQQDLLAALVTVPAVTQALIKIAERKRKQQRKAEEGAALLLAQLLQRAGAIVLTPDDNHLDNNQELLAFLRSAEASLRQLIEKQSRDRPPKRTSIKRGGDRRDTASGSVRPRGVGGRRAPRVRMTPRTQRRHHHGLP